MLTPSPQSAAALTILRKLREEGYEAYLAGGCVRDLLLGRIPKDYDIATAATPEIVLDLFPRTFAVGAHFGVVLVSMEIDGEATLTEVATFRSDGVYSDGRHPDVVRYTLSAEEDVQRRDFTINGLSVGADGIVHDHVGGLDDIATRRVRFIGDPEARIAEDYLRILRFFRIHAAYGAGEPDRAGYLACVSARAGLATLSAERLRMEMLKLMVAQGAAGAIVAMTDGGLLLSILGGIAYTGPFAKMIAVERLLGLEPGPIRRLGALAVAVTEDARRVASRLRLTNAEARALDSMGHRWWRLAGMDEATARRRLYRLGEAGYRDRLLLAWARAGDETGPAPWRELATLPERWSAPKFPLKAADFIARGIAEGPALGQVLALAEDAWLAAEFPLDQSALKAIADQTVTRFRRDHRL